MKHIIKTTNLAFGYRRNSNILENFNIEILEGELIGLLGPNGAGKSTLLRLLSGFFKPSSGTVYANGIDIASLSHKKRAELIAVVSQDVFSIMPYTVRQIVEMGRFARVSRFVPLGKQDIDAVNAAMNDLDILPFAERQFNELSGGEKQRVKIAAAIAQQPKILFLDEPTSQLDIGHSINLMQLIQKLNRTANITIAIVSHDIQLVSSFLNRVIILKDGKVVDDGDPEKVITGKMIHEVYNCDSEILYFRAKRSI